MLYVLIFANARLLIDNIEVSECEPEYRNNDFIHTDTTDANAVGCGHRNTQNIKS